MKLPWLISFIMAVLTAKGFGQSPTVYGIVKDKETGERMVGANFTQQSTIKLSYKEMMNIPSLGGEPDILKAFQYFPGISSGNEGSSDIFVRGGGKGENLFLIENIQT